MSLKRCATTSCGGHRCSFPDDHEGDHDYLSDNDLRTLELWFVVYSDVTEPGFPTGVFADVDGDPFLFRSRAAAIEAADVAGDRRAYHVTTLHSDAWNAAMRRPLPRADYTDFLSFGDYTPGDLSDVIAKVDAKIENDTWWAASDEMLWTDVRWWLGMLADEAEIESSVVARSEIHYNPAMMDSLIQSDPEGVDHLTKGGRSRRPRPIDPPPPSDRLAAQVGAICGRAFGTFLGCLLAYAVWQVTR